MIVKFFIGFLLIATAQATLGTEGPKCGEKRCSTMEYCSPYDSHCRSCSAACDSNSPNHEPQLCAKDCQEFLHDQLYIRRSELRQYEDLKGEVQRLRIISTIAITLTCISILVLVYLLAQSLQCWKKLRKIFRRAFIRNWAKAPATAAPVVAKNNKVQDDPELGVPKQNGLKLSMPTISASVAASKSTVNSNGTPNTTSTPLSRRHPSEDTTLDYAYDNPAMTPSPEVAQLRTKRESSF